MSFGLWFDSALEEKRDAEQSASKFLADSLDVLKETGREGGKAKAAIHTDYDDETESARDPGERRNPFFPAFHWSVRHTLGGRLVPLDGVQVLIGHDTAVVHRRPRVQHHLRPAGSDPADDWSECGNTWRTESRWTCSTGSRAPSKSNIEQFEQVVSDWIESDNRWSSDARKCMKGVCMKGVTAYLDTFRYKRSRGWRIFVSFIAIECEGRKVVLDARGRAPYASGPRQYLAAVGAAFDFTINGQF